MKIAGLQGDVVKLGTSSGSAVASYEYDAWGNILSKSGTMAEINPLRYRGYYYDAETSFYYLQSRYYDPVNRRFINADFYTSTGQGFAGTNMFSYCLNNPVVLADTTGNYAYYVVNSVETEEISTEKEEKVTYETTIEYTYVVWNTMAIFSPEVRYDGSVTYQYVVDYRGVITYDNGINPSGEIGDKEISSALAEEMQAVAKKQVSGALSGRTTSGIAQELQMHSRFSFLAEKIRIADIGGLDSKRADYDYNAKMFENPWKIGAVIWEMIQGKFRGD